IVACGRVSAGRKLSLVGTCGTSGAWCTHHRNRWNKRTVESAARGAGGIAENAHRKAQCGEGVWDESGRLGQDRKTLPQPSADPATPQRDVLLNRRAISSRC